MATTTTAQGGDGFLSLRLERALDMELRRRIGMRDWAMAMVVVTVAQLVEGTSISWAAFAALLCASLGAIATWYWLFPRLPQRRALWLEVGMNAATAFVALGLVAASGWAESPYIFFYAFIIVFIAAFVELAVARTALIVLVCLCALAPIAFDWEHATTGNFIPTILIAVTVWAISGALIALKRMSAVGAEFEARRLAYVDATTGAATRRAIDEYARMVSAAGLQVAAAYVRATAVGDVNRVGGHIAGDRTLHRIADAMRDASGSADQVVRLGGVEFAVLLPGSDRAAAAAWVARFRERLALADARAADQSHTAAIAGSATGVDFTSAVAAAHTVLESANYGGTLPACAPSTPAERADHLREQLARADQRQRRSAIESVRAPAGVWLSLLLAALLGATIALTGGAASVWLSVSILLTTYFATFGTRIETIVATVASLAAVLIGVIAQAPVSSIDQIRTFTVLVTILVLADTVQRNVRKLLLAERRAAELSLVDTQTGLSNRNAFERDLIGLLPRGRRVGPGREERLLGTPAVIAIDLTDVAAIAARIGRANEDFALLAIAEGLRDAVGGDGTIYRIGGEDYGVILRAHHRQHVDEMIARCREELEIVVGAGSPLDGIGELRIRYGAAIWQQGMTAADLAAAAVSDQPVPSESPVLAVR